MTGLAAGRLRHRVTLRSPARTRDDYGQEVAGWTDVATVRADVRHPSGKEAITAGAEVATTAASFRIRFRADVNAGWRVLHRGALYDITAVLPDSESGRQWVDLVGVAGAVA